MNSRLQLRFASLKKNNFFNQKKQVGPKKLKMDPNLKMAKWSMTENKEIKNTSKYLDILKMLLKVC